MVHLEINQKTHNELKRIQEEMEKLESTHQKSLGMEGAVLLSFDRVIMRSLAAWEQMAGV